MIKEISHYFESRMGVYLHPRFILSVLGLGAALLVFSVAYVTSHLYTESVRIIGPGDAEFQEGPDARM